MEHIKDDGYYQGEITPIGPGLDYGRSHDRDQLSSPNETASRPS
jgi:putative glutathione S-transferase